MVRIAAVCRNAEMARGRAQILLALPARRAGAATDPRIDRDLAPRRRRGIVLNVRSGTFDHARDLVTEREGQGAARRDVEFFVAVERDAAVRHVQAGVPNTSA